MLSYNGCPVPSGWAMTSFLSQLAHRRGQQAGPGTYVGVSFVSFRGSDGRVA